jgi:hypothetical protein
MKLKPQPCHSCGKTVAICYVRGGTWMPFELDLIPAAADAVDAYLPLRIVHAVTFVPIEEVAPRHIESVRWYAQRHRCAAYLRSKAEAYQAHLAKREHVGGLGDAVDALLDEWNAVDHQARLAPGEIA